MRRLQSMRRNVGPLLRTRTDTAQENHSYWLLRNSLDRAAYGSHRRAVCGRSSDQRADNQRNERRNGATGIVPDAPALRGPLADCLCPVWHRQAAVSADKPIFPPALVRHLCHTHTVRAVSP